MAQSSYYTCNKQPILLSHRYPSPPNLDSSLPPLSHLLITDNNNNNKVTQLKSQLLASGGEYYSTQPPSTVLTNTDASLASSTDLFDPVTPAVTTTDTTGFVLTSAPLATVSAAAQAAEITPMYLNDPVTAAAAMTTAATMIYGPTMLPPVTTTTTATSSTSSLTSPALSLSSTSSPMHPLLLAAAAAAATTTTTTLAASTGLDPSLPYLYSASPSSAAYNNINNTTITTRPRQNSVSSNTSDKVYSFVAIPGMDQKKRPRRKYDEIERLYHCTFGGCKKSYGTLNHLNSHVLMQNHGPKRHPSEFKEMRKEWRRQRKQREQQKKQAEKSNKEQQQQQPSQPTLTTAFEPPSFMPTHFNLQPMPLSGFY